MSITKEKKKEIFANVEQAVKNSKSLVFVNFHGLSVADATVVRKKLKKEGVGYMVAKKTIAKKVLTGAGISGNLPELAGELAIVYGKDLIAPARETFEFQKKFDKKLSILGGVFEGKYMTKAEMTEIAAIPPLQTLYGQFVNLINSPIQGFVMVLDGIAKKKTA